MLKEFKKYVTEQDKEQFKQFFTTKFTEENYLMFLRKFRGSMIYRGRSSLSYKYIDYIWKDLKEFMQERKRRISPYLILKKAVFNLIPLLSISSIKRGKRVQNVPVLLKQHRRMVFVNKWLLSSQKNKTNVRGIKIEDISKLILDTARRKGNAYVQKMENQKRAFNARYILLRPREFNAETNPGFYDLQQYVLRQLKRRAEANKIEKDDDDIEETLIEVRKILLSLKFFKVKSKSRFFRTQKKMFRYKLRGSWEDPLIWRVYTIMDLLDRSYVRKNNKFLFKNRELVRKFIKKYQRVWRKRKQIF